MIEQTGEEIDWEKCTEDLEDFPDSVHNAFAIYNSLANKIYPDVGFVGKDLTYLDKLYEMYHIETTQEKEWTFELILFLDSHNITTSQKKIKSEYDKIKRK